MKRLFLASAFLTTVLTFVPAPSTAITLQSFAAVGGALCCNAATMRVSYGIGVIGAEPAYQGSTVRNDLFLSLDFCGLAHRTVWSIPVINFGAPGPDGINGFRFLEIAPSVPPLCPIEAKAGIISQVGGTGILPLAISNAESACFAPCGFCPTGTGEI